MKKIFLLLAGSIIALGANAQYARHSVVDVANTKKPAFINVPGTQAAAVHLPGRTTRTTGVNFVTEDFSSGAATGVPTGWSVGTITGGTWHWDDMASSSTYSLGVFNSTTASNGWMIFDSDSIGAHCSCAPSGWLQSPAYDCSAHTTVRLSFENLYKSFYDSCSVWVSTSPAFTTYTDFPVALNDGLATNVETANPSYVYINISSVAASQATVYLRFVYYGVSGGSYSWLIDDLGLSELDPHDVGISGSFVYMPDATAYNSSLFTTPIQMVDSIYPVTQLSNYGANAETNVAVNAQIFQNGTSVYNHSDTYPSLPLSALDSLVQGFTGYLPNDTGTYLCAFSTTVTGDAEASNNYDSVSFYITDTLWNQNQGDITGAYYSYESSTTSAYYQGTRFDVPSNSAGDTVTGFGIVFDPNSVATTAGAKVSVQLYSSQQSSSGWAYQATSFARAITAADITPAMATSPVWAYFGIDSVASGGLAPFILQSGTTYAAVVQVNGVTTDLLIDATSPSNANGFAGYFGQADTSFDDGGQTFGGTLATGNSGAVPLVSMYFGHLPHSNGIQNINGNVNTVNAYPNPAANQLNVSYNVAGAGNVSVSLTDMIGQQVAVQDMGNVSSGKAVFNTASLPDGMYIYTLQANGVRTTGHVVIAH